MLFHIFPSSLTLFFFQLFFWSEEDKKLGNSTWLEAMFVSLQVYPWDRMILQSEHPCLSALRDTHPSPLATAAVTPPRPIDTQYHLWIIIQLKFLDWLYFCLSCLFTVVSLLQYRLHKGWEEMGC